MSTPAASGLTVVSGGVGLIFLDEFFFIFAPKSDAIGLVQDPLIANKTILLNGVVKLHQCTKQNQRNHARLRASKHQ